METITCLHSRNRKWLKEEKIRSDFNNNHIRHANRDIDLAPPGKEGKKKKQTKAYVSLQPAKTIKTTNPSYYQNTLLLKSRV